MKNLNLHKTWEILNKLYNESCILEEQEKYVYLLRNSSNYTEMGFEGFLNYYSFKIDGDDIIIFNNDGVPYEDYTNDDFSTFPICLLSFSAEKLENWIKTEIDLQLERQEREKIREKEDLKNKIEVLQKQLLNFGE